MSEYCYVKCDPNEYTIKKGAFRYTGQKSAIIIPDEATEFKSTAGKNLKAVYIGKNISKVSTKKVEWFEVDRENPYFASLDGVLFNKDFSELHKYPILNKRTEYVVPSSTTKIKKEAFVNATIKNLTLHDDIRTIEEDAFRSTKKLDKIKWPRSATTIDFCVFSNSSISAIELPETLERIESFAFAFSQLKSITFPNSVTYLGSSAFERCKALEKLTLSNRLTEIPEHCFYYCEKLDAVVVPDSVKTIGDSAFYSCNSLKKIALPADITKIPKSCFSYCSFTNLSALPNSIETIEERAFFANDSLEIITLPSSLKTLGNNAFSGCSNVTSITLPEGLETIGQDAFACKNKKVKSIVVPDSVKEVGTIFDDFENVTKHTLTEEEKIKKKEAAQKHAEEKAQREKWEKSSEETREFLARIREEGIYVFQTNALKLVKAREENASKLNDLYTKRNFSAYNDLLLSINEIPKTPVFIYNCCNKVLKLYPRNAMDGTFAIEVSGIVYLINVISDSIRDNYDTSYRTDASELDRAIMTRIAGGAFLGYIATSLAQIYTDITVDVTFYNKKTNKDIVKLVFADNYKVQSSQANYIAEQISSFSNTMVNICAQNISDDEIATHAYIDTCSEKIHQAIASQNARLAEKAKKDAAAAQQRFDDYWKEHADIKASLEAEKLSINNQIKLFEDDCHTQISVLNNEINDMPEKAELINIEEQLKQLNVKKKKLGFFEFRQKKALDAEIDCYNAKKKHLQSEIAAKTIALTNRINDLKSNTEQKISQLQNRCIAIESELTKPR